MSDHAATIREALGLYRSMVRSGESESEPSRKTFHDALAALVSLTEERKQLEEDLSQARRAVSAYYNGHVEEGDPPCPCESCDQARAVFRDALRSLGDPEKTP